MSRSRHEGAPPNASSWSQDASSNSASRWFRLASSSSDATKNRTSAAKKSPAMVFLLWAPAHKLYVCSSGTRAGSDGHRHVRLVRSRIPGGSCRGDREATPGGPPGVEGRRPPAGDEQTSPRQVQAAVRPRDPRGRPDRVRRHSALPDARRAHRDGRRRQDIASDGRASRVPHPHAPARRGAETGTACESRSTANVNRTDTTHCSDLKSLFQHVFPLAALAFATTI